MERAPEKRAPQAAVVEVGSLSSRSSATLAAALVVGDKPER